MNALVYVNIDGPFWTIKEQKNLQKVVLEYVNILRLSSYQWLQLAKNLSVIQNASRSSQLLFTLINNDFCIFLITNWSTVYEPMQILMPYGLNSWWCNHERKLLRERDKNQNGPMTYCAKAVLSFFDGISSKLCGRLIFQAC